MSGEESDWLGALWFAATVVALVVLFAAALRVRVYGSGWRRWALRLGLIGGRLERAHFQHQWASGAEHEVAVVRTAKRKRRCMSSP